MCSPPPLLRGRLRSACRCARRRATARLIAGWLLFAAGQWTVVVALGVVAFDSGGAAGVGAVTTARLLPAMLAAPAAGALVDRFDRGRLVLLCCLALVGTLAVGAASVSGARLPTLVLVTTAIALVAAVPRPAMQALLPSLARDADELTRATAAWSAADSAAFLVGGGGCGLAMSLVGAPAIIFVAAGCTAATALLALSLPRVSRRPGDRIARGEDAGSALLAGLRTVSGTPLLHAPFALLVGLLFLEGTSDVQLVALAIDRLGLGAQGPGLLYLAWGVGGVLGAGALLLLVRRSGYGRALVVGAGAFGLMLAASGAGDAVAGGVLIAMAAMVPVGVGFSLVEHAVMGVVGRLADDAVIGRVYGVCEVLYGGVAALGALAAPGLIQLFGVGGSLAVTGLAYAAAAVLAWRPCARLDRHQRRATRRGSRTGPRSTVVRPEILAGAGRNG